MPQTYARTAMRRSCALTIAIATGLCCLFIRGGQHSSVFGVAGVSAAVFKKHHHRHLGKHQASATAEIVDKASDAAFSGSNNRGRKEKKERRHHGDKANKKKMSLNEYYYYAQVKKHEWHPLVDKLFPCWIAPAVCNPHLDKSVLLSTIAAAKMNEDIWFIGGWALSLVGFVIFGIGVWISKIIDGDNNVLKGASGTTRKEGDSVGQYHQTFDAQSMEYGDEDDDSSNNIEGDGDIESPGKQGDECSRKRCTAQPTLFSKRCRMRKKDGEPGSQHHTGDSESVGNGPILDANEMEFLSKMPLTQAKDRQARLRFIDSNKYNEKDNNDDPYQPKLKQISYHLKVGPNATSVRAIIQRISGNIMTYWTDTSLVFARPLLSFKCFIAFLLFIELNDIMAPAQSMLATPEVVSLIRAYPKKQKYVKPYVEWFMPGMIYEDIDGGVSVDAWVRKLEVLRCILLVSWFAFLLLPKKFPLANGASYAAGSIIYVYLGVIGLMYDLRHTVQGCMLFILAAIPTIPFLETSRRANHWLRKFLYIGVLVPIYLFSGISKFRYLGIIPNLTGLWLWSHFRKNQLHRAAFKSLFSFIGRHHWVMAIFSWGNILIEIVLPMQVMLYNEAQLVQWAFHAIAIMFHVTIFLLLGPNFARYCLMHLYAVDIPAYVSCFSTNDQRVRIYRPNKMDWGRIGYAIVILFAWWYVQVNSDVMHLTGQENWKTRINPYWPFPEFSMFAKPKDNVNFYIAFVLSVLSFATLAIDMMRNRSLRFGCTH
ncbi:hypothetical protein ACHAWF_008760 [Thalassiosira exigua]